MDAILQMGLVISFLTHGICKNLVVGGIPILLVTYYRGRHGHGNDYYLWLARGMSHMAPLTLGLAIVFGVITWVVVRLQYDWILLPVFGSEFLTWIVLLILLVAGYWGIMKLRHAHQKGTKTSVALGSLVTFCMLAVTGIFVSSHIDMLVQDSRGVRMLLDSTIITDAPSLWPRFCHMVLGGFVTTGLVLTVYGSLRPQCPEDSDVDPAPYDTRLVRYGVGWVLGGTVPQVVVGPWFFLAIPSEVRAPLIDGTSTVSLVFFLSLTLALLALVLLNSSLMVPQHRGLVWSGVGCMILTIVFMVLVREEVRKIWLISHGDPVAVGSLSWLVVLGVVMIVSVGLYLAGRYVTLSHNQAQTH